MNLDDSIKLGLGLLPTEWVTIGNCEQALRAMAEVLELQRTQEPFAVVERVHGQMVLRFTNGQVLQQVAEGTKLYRLQTLPSDTSPQRRSHAPTGEAKHAATTGRTNSEPVIVGEGHFGMRSDIIRDYAIWQAITDLESRCRHRASGLQIEIEDREHEPVVQYALEILEECGVEIIRDARYPNIKINYDRSTNKFFGKSS